MTKTTNFLGNIFKKFSSNRRLSIFIYCLVLSTFFWLLSSLSKDYVASFPIEIQYTQVSNNFVLTEQPPEFIDAEIRGSGFGLLAEKLSFDLPLLQIDLNSAKPHYIDNRYYLLTSSFKQQLSRKLEENLNLVYLSPDTLYFSTEKRISKVVSIELDKKIDFKPGFLIRGKIETNPNKVVVSGPASILDTVESIKSEELNYTLLEDSVSFSINLINPNEEKVLLNPKSIDGLIPVEKFTEKKISLPIEVLLKDKGTDLKIFPEMVELTYLVPLSKYEYLDEKIVSPKVVYSKDKKGSNTLKIEVEDAVTFGELINVNPPRVEFIIRK